MMSVKIPKTNNAGGIQQNEEYKKQGIVTAQQNAVNFALISAGRQLMQNSVDTIASFNGNTLAVKKANEVLSIGADILSVATTGWIGLIAVGSKYINKIGNSFLEQRANNIEYELAFKRSGNAALSNSRGY